MALKFLFARDLGVFGDALSDRDVGISGQLWGFPDQNAEAGWQLYVTARDRFYVILMKDSTGAPNSLAYLEPDLLSLPNCLGRATAGAQRANAIVPGQFNPSTGQQRIFTYGTAAGGVFTLRPINLDTLELIAVPAFTGPNGDFTLQGSDIGTGTEGGWDWLEAAGQVEDQRGGGLFFEGLTDGIPGETLLTGANVYPQGLMWQAISDCTFQGIAKNNVFGWIDIDTRRMVGRPGGLTPTKFPARATTTLNSPATDQNEPPIGADSFSWIPLQYMPDADATFAQPKGEILFGIHQTLVGSNTLRAYVRFADFNPFNLPSVPGVPPRVHGQIRLTSRMLVPTNPMMGLAGYDTAVTSGQVCFSYDPLRRRLVVMMHDGEAILVGAHNPVGSAAAGFWSRTVDPVIVSAPAARDVPRTGQVVTFEVFVAGDLAEPVSGATVSWTLTRRSTRDELLTISGGIGTTSQLANFPVDVDVLLVPELEITANGVPLVLTTDYTVNVATGLITWVTSQVGKTVLASYRHRTDAATPPFGTLLGATSVTDARGNARIQVFYPDNDAIVGEIDNLAAVASV